MKKTLLALAVVSTLSSVAYAEDTSITVYGNVDAAVKTSSNQDSSGSRTTQVGDGITESFVGFKGQENLGNGLKAVFQLEEGFNIGNGTSEQNGALVNNGTNSTFGRQVFVGLSDNIYGTLTIGRQNTLGYDTLMATDVYSIANNIALAGYQSTLSGLRWNNSVKYTNQLDGFNFGVQYASGNQVGSTTNDSAYSLNAGYNAKNWLVQAVYQKANDTSDGTLGSLSGQKQEFWSIGGKYLFNEGTSLFGQYVHNNFDVSNQTNEITTLGVAQQLTSAITLKGSATYDSQINVNDGHRETYSALVDYAFSKHTNAYASVDYNKFTGAYSNSDYSLNTVTNPNNSSTGVSIGIRHSF